MMKNAWKSPMIKEKLEIIQAEFPKEETTRKIDVFIITSQ